MNLPTVAPTLVQDQESSRLLFARCVDVGGGPEWLALKLDKPISYASKIREAISGTGDRKVQSDWWLPLLEDEAAFELWRQHHEQRYRMRIEKLPAEVSDEDLGRAYRRWLRSKKNDDLRAASALGVAAEAGVKPEDIG